MGYDSTHPLARQLIKATFDILYTITPKNQQTDKYDQVWTYLSACLPSSKWLLFIKTCDSHHLRDVKEKLVGMIILAIHDRELTKLFQSASQGPPQIVLPFENKDTSEDGQDSAVCFEQLGKPLPPPKWADLIKAASDIDRHRINLTSRLIVDYKGYLERTKVPSPERSLNGDEECAVSPVQNSSKLISSETEEPVKQICLIPKKPTNGEKLSPNGSVDLLKVPGPAVSPGLSKTPSSGPGHRIHRRDPSGSPGTKRSFDPDDPTPENFEKNSSVLFTEKFEKVLQRYSYAPKPELALMKQVELDLIRGCLSKLSQLWQEHRRNIELLQSKVLLYDLHLELHVMYSSREDENPLEGVRRL